jgi:hypothetical protein
MLSASAGGINLRCCYNYIWATRFVRVDGEMFVALDSPILRALLVGLVPRAIYDNGAGGL